MRSLTFLLMMALPLQAQGLPPATEMPEVPAVMQGLPQQVLKKMRAAPDKFLVDAAKLILGYGGPQGIDLAGIDTFIAMERARVRARAMSDLVVADLDADGAVSRQELAVVMAAAPASARGKLLLAHAAADTDKNGMAVAAEIWRAADDKALQALDEADADALRAFLMFDMDGDGVVTLPEVSDAVDAMRQPV